MSPIARAAHHAAETVERCADILHDLAAQSPQAAAETVRALRQRRTPAAMSLACLVEQVAEARHGYLPR